MRVLAPVTRRGPGVMLHAGPAAPGRRTTTRRATVRTRARGAGELPTAPTDATVGSRPAPTGPPAWRTVLGWTLAGVSWGVVARAWMRLIATDPAFTWSGTLFIIEAAGLWGLLVGVSVALAARGRARSGRVAGVVAILPLGVGQGAVMLPTIVFGAVAARRKLPRLVLRSLLGLVAGLAALALVGAPLPVAIGVAGVPVLAGRWLRPVSALVAVASYVAVVASFVPGLPLVRSIVGAAVYGLLLAAVVVPLVRAVREGDVSPSVPRTPASGPAGRRPAAP